MNKRKFDFSGISAWHEKGYTGKGIRIANLEGTDPALPFFHGKIKDPFGNVSGVGRNYHGHQTADILHQVAPDAEIYILSSGAGKASGRFIEESIPFMESEGIHLVNASKGGINNRILNERIKQAQQHGITFVTSAGNEADSGPSGYARSGVWIAVGAVHLSGKGEIIHAKYSSIGEEVDFVQFSNLYVHDARPGYEGRVFPVQGTSFSSPMLCGMLALVQQLFLERAGRTLNQDELYEFMKDYSIDLWEPGHDVKSGYGLFLLPEDPDSIDIAKYIGKEELKLNNPEYIIIHHSATAQGDAASFRRYHLSLGWLDIGYHYVINNGTYQPDGLVETGRSEDREGAHCTEQAMNRRSIGVCLVGDFDQDKPTEKQMESLIKLCRGLMAKYNIPVERVIGHREAGAPKTCPGKNFDMEELRMILKTSETKFEDVPQNHWAKTDIEAVAAAGIMSGYPDGRFGPDEPVTRAQLAAVVNRLRRGYYGERS